MRSEFWLLTPAELAYLAADWRKQQDVEDMRAALGPFVAARVGGNKSVQIKDFLVTAKPEHQVETPPEGDQDAMAAAFRAFARQHNAEIERQRRRGGL